MTVGAEPTRPFLVRLVDGDAFRVDTVDEDIAVMVASDIAGQDIGHLVVEVEGL